jgi:hypothetical protein
MRSAYPCSRARSPLQDRVVSTVRRYGSRAWRRACPRHATATRQPGWTTLSCRMRICSCEIVTWGSRTMGCACPSRRVLALMQQPIKPTASPPRRVFRTTVGCVSGGRVRPHGHAGDCQLSLGGGRYEHGMGEGARIQCLRRPTRSDHGCHRRRIHRRSWPIGFCS